MFGLYSQYITIFIRCIPGFSFVVCLAKNPLVIPQSARFLDSMTIASWMICQFKLMIFSDFQKQTVKLPKR